MPGPGDRAEYNGATILETAIRRPDLSADASFYSKTFRWFYEQDDHGNAHTRSRRIALAWLDTPNARVAAAAIGFGRISPDVLIEATRRRILADNPLGDWTTPAEAEQYLREVLRQCYAECQRQTEGVNVDD